MQFCLWCSIHSNDDVYPTGNNVIMGDFNGANVCDSLLNCLADHVNITPLPLIPIIMGK